MTTEAQAQEDFKVAIKNIEAEIAVATQEAQIKNEAYQETQDRNSVALREALIANQSLNAKHKIYRDLMVKAQEEKRLNDAVKMAMDERLRASRARGGSSKTAELVISDSHEVETDKD